MAAVTPHRRIRFAPLPDPRRDDSMSSSSTSSSSSSTSTTPRSDSSPISSVASSPVTHSAALPCVPPLLTAPPKQRTGLSLLRPFKRSSTSSSGSSDNSLTPTPSIDATTTQSLPESSLFRPSSRESTDSTSTFTHSGWGLSRWTSASSSSGAADKERRAHAMLPAGSSPLCRVHSSAESSSTATAKKEKKKKKGRTMSLLFSSNSNSNDAGLPPPPTSPTNFLVPPTTPTSPTNARSTPQQSRHKGTRMLNGRVYGQKRPHTSPGGNNLFANARDDEDEFVEWGYGGMGSVRGARSAGVVAGAGAGVVNWERLHGGVGVGSNGAKKAATVLEDEDDGSGMGWVKRRREERERKKREAEAAEEKKKREEEVVVESTSNMSTPTPTRTSTMESPLAEEPESFEEPGQLPEHVPVVVTVPPTRPRHHHHHSSHSHKRSLSGVKVPLEEPSTIEGPTLSSEGGDANLDGLGPPATAEANDNDTSTSTPNKKRASVTSVSSSSSSTSDSESDSDSEDRRRGVQRPLGEGEEEEEDDEEEEVEEENEKRRRTAMSAGMEKVSRHHA